VSLAARPLAAFGDAARRLSRALVEPPLPAVAVEVRPRAVAAVRLVHDRTALGAAACVDLPRGALAVSLTKPNVGDPIALRAALRTALERAGALAGGPVSLVLPDPAVRLTLVPSEGLRGRRREAEEIVRFRLHKSLPFDVRTARLAWRVLAGDQALVAVSPDDVVRGYEEPLEALGLHPGLVEPASLSLASALAADGDAGGDRLLVNWDDGYVSFLLLRAGEPVLVRTLPGEASPEAVARQAVGTVQFHRDRLGGGEIADVVVRAAAPAEDQAVAVLGRALGRAPRLLEPWAALGSDEHGRAAQAVAGAAACAQRRTA
jgi:type IV pilus assembly protein PilM